MTRLEQLLSIASPPLCSQSGTEPAILKGSALGSALLDMLAQKNGFYAFESSLHVFPVGGNPNSEISLESWNAHDLWRDAYNDLTEGLLFFAEDIFQDQFCLAQDGIYRFKAETGQRAQVGGSLEEWADRILTKHQSETAWVIAHQWQVKNGPVPPGKRLMPKTPFFLGGEYSLENLWVGDSVEGMRFKGDLALQTRSLPDGASVRLHVAPRRDT